ncbi:MAG: recombinase family protein [Chitinophagales bacterium]
MKKVGIWLRVSTDDQAKGDSPEHHQKKAEMYAEVKSWEVVEIYHLEGVSGKSVMKHPEAQRMLADVKRGHITGLIFSKLARLARNTKELLDFAEYFHTYKADLVSLYESIDTSSPAGRFFYTLISAMAQWEREEISTRVAASVPIRAKLGKPLGGAAPYGYKWNDKKLEIDDKEAPIRKMMYELFLKLKRKTTVINTLNEQGYRTRKGAKFTKNTLTRLLRDPIAKGMRRMNYTQSTGEGKKWIEKPQDEWVFQKAPAIISEEVWDETQKLLDEQMSTFKRRTNGKVKPFTKVTHCACGGKFHYQTPTSKYVCKKCNNKIKDEDLDVIFHEQLTEYVISEDSLKEHLSDSNQKIYEKKKALSAIQSKIKELEIEINNLVQLHKEGEIPTKGFGELYNPIYEQLNQQRDTIPKLEGEIQALEQLQTSSEYMFDEARSVYKKWTTYSIDEKREIVNTITESIIVGEEDITINLLYLTPPNALLHETHSNGVHNHKDS